MAVEAFDCVFRRITLRKCTTGLDVKLKSGITAKFLEKNQSLGAIVYKHFEVISWVFTILLIASLVWTGISAYNYYEYGNCNGPSVESQQGLCLFDPTGQNAEITQCSDIDVTNQNPNVEPNVKDIDLSLFPTYEPKEAKDVVVYVGCYACVNTKKVNPTMNQLVVDNKDTIKFVFIHLPLHQEYDYILKLENCIYAKDKVAYWEFHNQLMQMSIENIKNKDEVLSIVAHISGISANEIIACSESKAAQELVERQVKEIKKMNVEGTPTIFVNEQAFIGPKPLRVYERQLSTDVDWFGLGLIGLGILILLIIVYFAVFRREG